jgi:tRNA threonylcarbamoyladenosine biosynthesis protein TsaE
MQTKLEIIFSKEQLSEVSTQLLQHFIKYKIYTFRGNLGAGKTTFITSLCQILGSTDDISSPTFSIINEYHCDYGKIYHFDLYRIKNLEEALDIGFEEYLYSHNYCFIEWPEKVAKILPNTLVVNCELSYISVNERRLLAWAD